MKLTQFSIQSYIQEISVGTIQLSHFLKKENGKFLTKPYTKGFLYLVCIDKENNNNFHHLSFPYNFYSEKIRQLFSRRVGWFPMSPFQKWSGCSIFIFLWRALFCIINKQRELNSNVYGSPFNKLKCNVWLNSIIKKWILQPYISLTRELNPFSVLK